MSIFEILMLVCFGVSWPISILKAVRTKTVAGKSPVFMSIVILGYASGIMHKFLYSQDWVIILYAINLVLVATDMFFYFYYSKNVQLSVLKNKKLQTPLNADN